MRKVAGASNASVRHASNVPSIKKRSASNEPTADCHGTTQHNEITKYKKE